MAREKKQELIVIVLPTGVLINESLWEKDAYDGGNGKPGEPQYKIEVAFDPATVEGEGTVEDQILDAACREWGDAAESLYLDGKIKFFLDGNDLAKGREEKGKTGDAYKGKLVLRASTKFNADGVDGPGGIAVYDEDVARIMPLDRAKIYPGCLVQIKVALKPNISSFTGGKQIKAYLEAVQRVGEGTRLVTPKNHAGAFKPVGRAAGAAPARRSRAG